MKSNCVNYYPIFTNKSCNIYLVILTDVQWDIEQVHVHTHTQLRISCLQIHTRTLYTLVK